MENSRRLPVGTVQRMNTVQRMKMLVRSSNMSGTGSGQAVGGFGRKEVIHGKDCRDNGMGMLWSWPQSELWIKKSPQKLS